MESLKNSQATKDFLVTKLCVLQERLNNVNSIVDNPVYVYVKRNGHPFQAVLDKYIEKNQNFIASKQRQIYKLIEKLN